MITHWEKIKEEEFQVGYRKVLQRLFKLPDGQIKEYTIKKESSAVCVVAITPDKKIILTKQYRPGPEQILLELPGGTIEKGEPPQGAAQRELLEETGYSGTVRAHGTCLDCAYSTMKRYWFVIDNCKKIQEPIPDATEWIEVVEMNLDEFRDLLRSGMLTDVEIGYLGLDALSLLS